MNDDPLVDISAAEAGERQRFVSRIATMRLRMQQFYFLLTGSMVIIRAVPALASVALIVGAFLYCSVLVLIGVLLRQQKWNKGDSGLDTWVTRTLFIGWLLNCLLVLALIVL
jgi:hypothetical protein